jgi:hypothetical protein
LISVYEKIDGEETWTEYRNAKVSNVMKLPGGGAYIELFVVETAQTAFYRAFMADNSSSGPFWIDCPLLCSRLTAAKQVNYILIIIIVIED